MQFVAQLIAGHKYALPGVLSNILEGHSVCVSVRMSSWICFSSEQMRRAGAISVMLRTLGTHEYQALLSVAEGRGKSKVCGIYASVS